MNNLSEDQLREMLEKKKKENQERMAAEAESMEDMLSETGNAEKLVSLLDGNARYIKDIEKWAYWGREKWNLNDDGEMIRRFKQVVDILKTELAKAEAEAKVCSDEEVQKIIKRRIASIKSWIKTSRGKTTITNSISLAAAEPGMSIKYNQFDKKGHFFGVDNGVVNLKTGGLISGQPEYLMLKSSQISYEQDSECPKWLKFLDDTMEGNQDKVDLLQQVAGSALVGNTKERMFILNGGGSNGKTTFVALLSHILGIADDDGYKVTVAPEVITGAGGSSADYALAKIKGSRLLVLNETGKTNGRSNVLDDTIVKRLVDSDDGFQARQIRGVPFEFACNATIALLTNHLPKVIATDEGIWRRISLITFNRSFSKDEKIQNLMEGHLKPESAGIMKWCVEGVSVSPTASCIYQQ